MTLAAADVMGRYQPRQTITLLWLGSRCKGIVLMFPAARQSAIHSGQAREHRDESLRSVRAEESTRPRALGSHHSLSLSTTTYATHINRLMA